MTKSIVTHAALRGLQARLEMERELGIDFMSVSNDLVDVLGALENTNPPLSPNPVVRKTPPALELPRIARGDGENPLPPPIEPQNHEVPTARPPHEYISLVPYVSSDCNPEKEELLAPLRAECESCVACSLCERRTRVAWGEGCLDADVLFIGEGPGKDEDREGRPFVGRSGRLLTDIIEKGMRIPRSKVYIANVVKCRPPGNRDPRPEEVAACSRFLNRQIEVIAPKVIVAVGGVAGCALLGLPPKSPGLRGKWRSYRGIPLRVIFHPSYLLRQRRSENDRTNADRQTWNDIQEVMMRLQAE